MKLKLLIVFIIIASVVYGQNNQYNLKKLSLNDAIKLALEKNKDVLLSGKDVLKSEAQINEAYGNALPQLNFTASYIRNIELPVLFIPPGNMFNPTNSTLSIPMGADNNYSASLSLSQVLFSAKVNTAIQIAKLYGNYTNYNAKATREEVVLGVRKTYYAVLLTQKITEVTEEGYQFAKKSFDNLKELYNQGMCSEYDLLRAEVQVARTQPMLIQAKNSSELAMNGLKNILGLELSAEISLSGKLEMEELSQELINAESPLATERNSSLKGLDSYEQILEKNITIQKSDYYPTLAAFGNYQIQSQDNTFKFKDYNWARSFMVGVQISYPIFQGLQTLYRTEQAEIDKEKVSLTKNKLAEGIKIQVEDARLRMTEAKKRIEVQAKSIDQAAKAVTIADVRFKSGVGTQLELIDAQVALTQTKTTQAQAIFDYLVARADWEKLSGFNQEF